MSSTSPDRPGFTLYNPAVLGKDDLCAQFVLRTDLYESLLASVRDADGERAPQHHLVTGPRGMGKTTLLHRLRFGIDDDPELGRRAIPLTFPEEQYDIRDLATLWRNALDALADALDARGDAAGAKSLDAEAETADQSPRTGRPDALLALLTGWAERRGAVLVLLLDNLDRVLSRLGEQEQWGLRKTLAAHPRLVVIAASTVPPASTYAYSKAFYDFFRHHPLEPLSFAESKAYLLRLAELRNAPGVRRAIEGHPERLAAVRDMTGGSPRALAILFLVLSEADELAAASALERVLDVVTPYYKHVIEALADRQQIVVDALAKHWHPATAHALSEATGLAVTEINSNLSRLEKAGMVEKVDPPGGGRYLYMLSERLLNIWYLMRSGRRARERLLWLVRFLEAMYGPEELVTRATRWIRPADALMRRNQVELQLAYANSVRPRDAVLARALEFAAADALAAEPDRCRMEISADPGLADVLRRKLETCQAAPSARSALRSGNSPLRELLQRAEMAQSAPPQPESEAASGGAPDDIEILTLTLRALTEEDRSAIHDAIWSGDVERGSPVIDLLAAARRWGVSALPTTVVAVEVPEQRARSPLEFLEVLDADHSASARFIVWVRMLTKFRDPESAEAVRNWPKAALFGSIAPFLMLVCGIMRRPLTGRAVLDRTRPERNATSESDATGCIAMWIRALVAFGSHFGLDAAIESLEVDPSAPGTDEVRTALKIIRDGNRDQLAALSHETRTVVGAILRLWDSLANAPWTAHLRETPSLVPPTSSPAPGTPPPSPARST